MDQSKLSRTIIVFLILISGFLIAHAFTNPSANPPSGNPGPISIGIGGTSATSTSGARSNLGAAASGANTDITSLAPYTGNPIQFGSAGIKFNDGTIQTTAAAASQWTTSGSNIYYSAGDVGIGSAPGAYNLDVAGTARIQNGLILSTGSYAVANGTGQAEFILDSAGSDWGKIQNDSANTWSLSYTTSGGTTIGTPVLTWNGSGEVGIDNSGPSYQFQVSGGGNGDVALCSKAGCLTGYTGTAYPTLKSTGSYLYLDVNNTYAGWLASNELNIFGGATYALNLGSGGIALAGNSTANIDGINELNSGGGTLTTGGPVIAHGTVYSTTGGIEFPDGSVQTTAAQTCNKSGDFCALGLWNQYNTLSNSACPGWADIYYYSGSNCTGTDVGGTYYYTGAPLWTKSGASANSFAYQSEYYSTYNGVQCSMVCANTTGSVGNVFTCQSGYTQTTVQYGTDSGGHALYMVSCTKQ